MLDTHNIIILCLAVFTSIFNLSCDNASDSRPELGKPCENSSECTSDMFCDSADEPTIAMCTSHCSSSEQCAEQYGERAFCIGTERCVINCETDLDCEDDQYCKDLGHWCKRRECSSDSHCWRFACDLLSGHCYESCSNNAQCKPGYECHPEIGLYECI